VKRPQLAGDLGCCAALRPPRSDIASPPLRPGLAWLGGPEPRLDRLVARGPLLVHFFDLAQLNSVRTLPYVAAWRRRYAEHGLNVIGVHSPRFGFTRPAEAVEAALPRLGVEWPVAVDVEHLIWRDYGCGGWPSTFLWSRGGALRWHHLGEGEYEETETVIREELNHSPVSGWPPLLEPLRPGDAAGATVIAPTEELLPGGSLEAPWPGTDDDRLEVEYAAGGAYAAADGSGSLLVSLDGEKAAEVSIDGPGLYELAAHPHHGEHLLELAATGEQRLYSVQFAPGAPAP
jgi:hypothetical protein